MTDPATLPGGTKRLTFSTLAERQRYDTILSEARARFKKEGIVRLSDSEVLLAVLNDHEAFREDNPAPRSARANSKVLP